MRALLRYELDFNKPINLKKLSPSMKIYASIVCKWRSSDWYQRNLNRSRDLAHQKQIARDERFKEILLATIYKELNDNSILNSLDENVGKCIEVQIKVEQRFQDSLERVLEHKDFLPYIIKRVEENKDIRIAFPDMPIMLLVSKRAI